VLTPHPITRFAGPIVGRLDRVKATGLGIDSDLLTDRWLTIDGHRLFYRQGIHTQGKRPVVLLHGIGVSGRYMVPLAHRLAPRYDVRVPDLPGFGRSYKPRPVLGVEGLADALEAWMEACDLSGAVVVGNSFGCQVAAAHAHVHPGRVDHMVLQAPTMDPRTRAWPGLIAHWLADIWREPSSLHVVMARDLVDCGPRRIVVTLNHAFKDKIEDTVGKLAIPATVVRGRGDTLVSRAWVEELAGRARRGELLEMDGGHALNHSHPRELASLVATVVEA
jgi:2-hydroxy-6-oxonona-2,4-dienedioate hydrolase